MDFFHYKVQDFEKHKKKLIDLIHKIQPCSIHSCDEKISRSDWRMKIDRREYVDYFLNNISQDFFKNLLKKMNTKKVRIQNMWYQIYKKGDFHTWHTHPQTHFTNVFFINLPSEKNKTKIKKLDNSDFNFQVKEGDIITFPGYLKHCSPINETNIDKIVISFNIDIEEHL